MSTVQSRNGLYKLAATIGVVFLTAFLSACDVLATEGARDAIANGREVRDLEDRELGPLQREMDDIWVYEIQPREQRLEELHREMREFEEDVLRPMWDEQGDMWAPGGKGTQLQEEFEARYRELDLKQRAIDVEQRDLDNNWQQLWNNGGDVDSEFQALEDLRYDKQRELDRLYRFGNRPIEDIWDEINALNSGHGWGNTDSQIESEEINIQLRQLYDQYEEIQNQGYHNAAQLEEEARVAQEQLDYLYNFGWGPINEIHNEIAQLEAELGSSSTSTVDSDTILAQIADLENQRSTYEANRDAEVAALTAQLADAGTSTETTTPETTSTTTEVDPATTARIAELQQLIADLEVQSAELVAVNQAEQDQIATLNGQIAEKSASYDQQISDATTASQATIASVQAEIAAIDTQLTELNDIGGDDVQPQIASLTATREALTAQEASVPAALVETIATLEAERDSGIAELQASVDAVTAGIDTTANDAVRSQIDTYTVELNGLQAEVDASSSDDNTTVLVSNTTSSSDIQASIDAVNAHWNSLIGDVNISIETLRAQLSSTPAVDNSASSRLESLKIQAATEEEKLYSDVAYLEAAVNDLWNQANNAWNGGSPELYAIEEQINALNNRLEQIWQQDSVNGLEVLKQVQVLENNARVLEEELEQQTRALEEELWDIDDQMSVFHRDQGSGNNEQQAEFEAQMAELQQRRFDIEEERWALDEEQQIAFDELDDEMRLAEQEIRDFEDEQHARFRAEIREIEDEIRGFRDRQREIEREMGAARQLVEEKKRELEDKVFDALDAAAGGAPTGGPGGFEPHEGVVDPGFDDGSSGNEPVDGGPGFDVEFGDPDSEIDETVGEPAGTTN